MCCFRIVIGTFLEVKKIQAAPTKQDLGPLRKSTLSFFLEIPSRVWGRLLHPPESNKTSFLQFPLRRNFVNIVDDNSQQSAVFLKSQLV